MTLKRISFFCVFDLNVSIFSLCKEEYRNVCHGNLDIMLPRKYSAVLYMEDLIGCSKDFLPPPFFLPLGQVNTHILYI